jgi:hypothetical protein
MSTNPKPSHRHTPESSPQAHKPQTRKLQGQKPKTQQPAPGSFQSEKERLRLARERAETYREEPLDPHALARALEPVEEEQELPETLEEWQDLVSRRVDDAMRRGLFDNLAGQGKPLSLQRDPFVPEDQQMAYNLMKKNQITPGWIGDRKSILAAIEDLRQEIYEFARVFWARAAQTEVVDERARLAQQWDGCVLAWQERVDTLNGQILNLNLSQPFHYLEVYKLRLDEELQRVGAARALPVD